MNTYTGPRTSTRRWQRAEVVRTSLDDYDYEFECHFVDPHGPSLLSGVPIVFRCPAGDVLGKPRLGQHIDIETSTLARWRYPR